MRTINIDLRKVVQVDPFVDGLALHKEGREKTQYFVWNENVGRDATYLWRPQLRGADKRNDREMCYGGGHSEL